MNNKKQMIEINDLHKSYSSGHAPLEVLKGLDLKIHQGEIVAIVGESGCGKSTLLNLLGGLDDPTSGDILVNGHNIIQMSEDELSVFRNRFVGYVFQFHYLLPDFSAVENVMLPFLAHRFDKKKAKEKAIALLSRVGLEERADHRPSQLSGGEQQRVAIARALINEPSIVFADEPTGNLDERNSKEIQELMWELRDQYELTILLVTHNLRMAGVADRTVRLAYGRIDTIENGNLKG